MVKGPEAFRSISEASGELGVPQHVLRFWETRFSFIRPMKRAGGRRFYRRQDLDVLRGVQALLHGQGYTIKGVQRLYREEGVARVISAGTVASPAPQPEQASATMPVPALAALAHARLQRVLGDLEIAKAAVDRLLAAPQTQRLPAPEAAPIRRVP